MNNIRVSHVFRILKIDHGPSTPHAWAMPVHAIGKWRYSEALRLYCHTGYDSCADVSISDNRRSWSISRFRNTPWSSWNEYDKGSWKLIAWENVWPWNLV